MGSTTFIGAKYIPRPQLNFKDPIDNSDALWVPKISDKPNSIKPLALNIIYNDSGKAIGFEHPYKIELDLYEPPQEFIEPDPEPPTFPGPIGKTNYKYIETEPQLDELVEHLNTVKALAIDVEHHGYRTYQGFTCLIQISTDEGGDFIIDALAVREHLYKLNVCFTDPRKVKVFHGADNDVLWLQRDFGIYIVGMFDTFQAAKLLRLPQMSLKYLLSNYCGIAVDKRHQLADWRMRPLPDELLEYARQDTHYLLYVWRRMKAELLNQNCGSDKQLRAVFEKSKFVCGMTYKKNVVTETSHMAMFVRSQLKFDSRQMAALKMLYSWRDAQARQLDESTSYLLPNSMLLKLAETLPREVQGVHACCSPMPPFVKANIVTLHRMLLSCRQLPIEPVSYYAASTSTADMPAYRHPSAPRYEVHDLSHFPQHMQDDEDDFKTDTYKEFKQIKPQLDAMIPDEEKKIDFISTLNADAQMYIPPYYRYKGYRYLAKEEELKQIANKEATVAAIAQGDPLIKAEVLEKLQESKKLLNATPEKSAHRKRKMSTEEVECKKETNAQRKDKNSMHVEDNESAVPGPSNVEVFDYERADYKKFVDNRRQMRKEAKKKFSKPK